MIVFNRQNYTEIGFIVRSNKSLSILQTDYIEDYFGVDGQLTLRYMVNDTRIAIPMQEDVAITPAIPHDAFSGFIDLTTLPDGIYRVEGRVKDEFNHYTILSGFQTPLGTEEIQLFEVDINSISLVITIPKIVKLTLRSNPNISFSVQDKFMVQLQSGKKLCNVSFDLENKPKIDNLLLNTKKVSMSLRKKPEMTIHNVYTII